MKRIAIVLLLFLFASPGAAAPAKDEKQSAKSKTERQVRERLEQWVEALKRNDVAALDQILADDFQYILDDGHTRNKTEELAPNRAGDIKFEKLSLTAVKVFAYGDTAIATGVGTYKGSFKGRPFESSERFCDVYQKQKGQWRVIASRPVTLPLKSTQ